MPNVVGRSSIFYVRACEQETNEQGRDASGVSMKNVGILAYGSLIRDPGVEIEPLITERIPVETPFAVEFAKPSKRRGGAPTVVPHHLGQRVVSEILVLNDGVSLPEGRSLLWRRERRIEGSGLQYSPGTTPNSVLVKEVSRFHGVDHVLYTDFPEEGKIANPEARTLALKAVGSVKDAPLGTDGISYLMQVRESGAVTPLTPQYNAEIRRLTEADSLLQALASLQGIRLEAEFERKLSQLAGMEGAAGYCQRPEDNLIPGVNLADFETDLRAGAGSELDGHFMAARSSSALAVNTFAPFKRVPDALSLLEVHGASKLCFEKKLPTGLGGTPPHLDVWIEHSDILIAVESKLLEYFQRKKASYQDSYRRVDLPQAEDCWWNVLEESKTFRKRHLAVGQLVRHYLGLKRLVDERKVASATLLYLFWEPANAANLAICRQHRAEIDDLARRVADSVISFKSMSYLELWENWDRVPALAPHVAHLRARYEIKL